MNGIKPIFVVYDEIDNFVDKQENMSFNGWDVEVRRFDPMGWSKTNGVQVNGTWYTRKTVCPNEKGIWEFDERDVTSR